MSRMIPDFYVVASGRTVGTIRTMSGDYSVDISADAQVWHVRGNGLDVSGGAADLHSAKRAVKAAVREHEGKGRARRGDDETSHYRSEG
jgi:hypothetical protein